MKTLSIEKLKNKRKKYVAGLMSGTSLDGVDAVLLEIEGNGESTKFKILKFSSFPFHNSIKEHLLKLSSSKTAMVDDICTDNFLLAYIYSDAVKQLCKKADFPISKLDFIGSHGQTIRHLPNKTELFGYKISSTLQIGDPSVIAKLTGVLTVGDFRVADMALGGEGAPLIPYFDYIFFNNKNLNRALLNIGGIANITVIKKNSLPENVFAFDTGPGNMLIDFLSKKFFNEEFDCNGKIAASGKTDFLLLKYLIENDKFLLKHPPKSTGREYYGINYLKKPLKKFQNISKNDFLKTITEFTAYSVYNNYRLFIKNNIEIDELIISGGGAKNKTLVSLIKKYFGNKTKINNITKYGINPKEKEAVCFAILANETIAGNCSNLPNVTGSKSKTVLGKICLP